MEPVTLLFLAAGLSSRFGGNPKMLSKIGPNNESLFEMSIRQIKDRIKVCHIHIVVNSVNQTDIMNEVTSVGKKYNICEKITCNIQVTAGFREKPFGTADALASAYTYIKNPFILLNSDDLYDFKTFDLMANECESSKNYLIGFKLGSTLLGNKKANRAFINDDKSGNILSLQEKLNIEKVYYSQLELDNTYVSVNLLLLQPKILRDLTIMMSDFKEECEDRYDRVSEALLPDFLNKLIKDDLLTLEILKSPGAWNGITYQDDIKSIRKSIRKSLKN
jgi:NDP-sugar pyrophosphorylase family protein